MIGQAHFGLVLCNRDRQCKRMKGFGPVTSPPTYLERGQNRRPTQNVSVANTFEWGEVAEAQIGLYCRDVRFAASTTYERS